jgi:hypothetical protein
LVQENEGFKYANEVICTSSTDNAATLTVKSDSEHYNPSTDNTVNVSYTTSTGRSISEFFNNQTTYNITKNSDSSQTKYFPDTKPTETQVLQAITNYKSGDTFINTNQLKVKDGNNGIV